MSIRLTLTERDWRCRECGQPMCLLPQCQHQVDLRQLIYNSIAVCRACLQTDRRANHEKRKQAKRLYATTGENHTSPFDVLRRTA